MKKALLLDFRIRTQRSIVFNIPELNEMIRTYVMIEHKFQKLGIFERYRNVN